MLALQHQYKKSHNPYNWILLTLLVLLIIGGCTNNPDSEADENLLLAPDPNYTTATPFAPRSGSLVSPYDSLRATSTLIPSRVTPGAFVVEENLMPTPLPSGYQGLPVFVLSTNTNPLTGMTANKSELLERRPLAIKITQFPRYTRPQSGLSLADVVYEYYIEWGATRFIAVFYGNDAEQVGPVRSGRFFDEHIARMYQAFLVFKYADPRVYDYLSESDLGNYLVVPGVGSCPPFFVGEYERESYNNIFINTFKFKDCISRRKSVTNARPPLISNFFSNLPSSSSLVADRIYTNYSLDSYNYWDYLPEKNRYQRYQEVSSIKDGQDASYAPLTDALTNLPVMADNVVVLFVQHRFADQWQEEDEVYHIDLYGTGDAYVFRDGIAVEAIWHRNQLDQPILLTTPPGVPVYLKPGTTFYQVIGLSSESWQEGADWHFVWHTP